MNKRLLLLGLALGLSVAACDDDSSSGDKGTDGDAGADLADDLDKLGDRVSDVGKTVSDLNGTLSEIEGRINNLENPPATSCSNGDACMPDGFDVATTDFMPIVLELCTQQLNCCNQEGERNWVFGPNIKTAEDCVATFNDLVNNGYTPDYIDGPIVLQIVDVARALSDPNIRVRTSKEGVTACAGYIKETFKCTSPETSSERCMPPTTTTDPCEPDKLLVGQETAGEACARGDAVEECAAGHVCRPTGYKSQDGICSPKAAEGDRCTEDAECDELFCNPATGKCQAKAKENEACAYIDAKFFNLDTKIDCGPDLVCDPFKNVCVKECSAGALCTQNSQCPTGLVCDLAANRDLSSRGYGVCTTPVADGSPCKERSVYDQYGMNTAENACASGGCVYDNTDARYECAAKPASPATCIKKDAVPQDVVVVDCPAGQVCDPARSVAQASTSAGTFYKYQCSDLLDNNTTSCVTDSYDYRCKSGFCTFRPGVGSGYYCQAKVAADAACPTGDDAQCPAGQFCKGGTCATAVAIGGTCTLASEDCGPNARCWDVDGDGVGTVGKCYTTDGDLPNGTDCDFDNGACASGWCKPNQDVSATSSACADPIAVGQPCDLSKDTLENCGPNAYCNQATDRKTPGTCVARGTFGQPCDPNFVDSCADNRDCELNRGAYLCSSDSSKDKVCDGVL